MHIEKFNFYHLPFNKRTITTLDNHNGARAGGVPPRNQNATSTTRVTPYVTLTTFLSCEVQPMARKDIHYSPLAFFENETKYLKKKK
jgi:hypothetical protein